MSLGKITSPASWNVGTVDAPSWNQNVQDDVNYSYVGTGTSGVGLYYWIMPTSMIPMTDWAITTTALSGGTFYGRQTTAANARLFVPLTFPGNGDTSFRQITEIVVSLSAGSTGAISCALYQTSTLTTAPVATGGSPFTSVNSSGSGFQTVTLSGLTINPSATSGYQMQIISGQSGDFVYGVRVKIG